MLKNITNLIVTFLKRLMTLASYFDLTATRFWLSISAVLVGILMMLNDSSVLNVDPIYSLITKVMPASFWVTGLFVYGLAGIFSVAREINSTLFFVCESILGCAIWTGALFSAALLGGGHFPILTAVLFSNAMASWWVIVRYRLEDHSPLTKPRRIADGFE